MFSVGLSRPFPLASFLHLIPCPRMLPFMACNHRLLCPLISIWGQPTGGRSRRWEDRKKEKSGYLFPSLCPLQTQIGSGCALLLWPSSCLAELSPSFDSLSLVLYIKPAPFRSRHLWLPTVASPDASLSRVGFS